MARMCTSPVETVATAKFNDDVTQPNQPTHRYNRPNTLTPPTPHRYRRTHSIEATHTHTPTRTDIARVRCTLHIIHQVNSVRCSITRAVPNARASGPNHACMSSPLITIPMDTGDTDTQAQPPPPPAYEPGPPPPPPPDCQLIGVPCNPNDARWCHARWEWLGARQSSRADGTSIDVQEWYRHWVRCCKHCGRIYCCTAEWGEWSYNEHNHPPWEPVCERPQRPRAAHTHSAQA